MLELGADHADDVAARGFSLCYNTTTRPSGSDSAAHRQIDKLTVHIICSRELGWL